jgi:hypothetical protein
MTTNAFIFSWDCNGVEAIVPISQYEHWDAENTFRILADKPTERNPLDSIVRNLVLRARFNTQRHYEIYSIDCSLELDEQFWREQWAKEPQFTADLIRERGQKIYSDRATTKPVII